MEEKIIHDHEYKDVQPMYIVLGFRHIPVDPNDIGIVYEADNPIVFNNLEFALEVKKKATENLKGFMDMDCEAEIAELRILK